MSEPVQSLHTQANIAQLRAKAVDGTLTLEEMQAAIKLIRGDRTAAAKASSSSKTRQAKAVIPDADDMLKELGG